MRKFAMYAGLALVACGGGDAAQDQAAAPEADAPVAVAPAAGATHDVNMVLEGTSYLFVPGSLSISVGDQVTFHNTSGGPHNAQFWPDSIPAGAADALNAGMPDQMAPLGGPLLIGPDETYTVTFAGVPMGEYRFYCLPHLANGMVGVITVQ